MKFKPVPVTDEACSTVLDDLGALLERSKVSFKDGNLIDAWWRGRLANVKANKKSRIVSR